MAFGDLTTLADVKAWLQTGQAAFPDTDDGLRSVPGRIMSGIQFFEA